MLIKLPCIARQSQEVLSGYCTVRKTEAKNRPVRDPEENLSPRLSADGPGGATWQQPAGLGARCSGCRVRLCLSLPSLISRTAPRVLFSPPPPRGGLEPLTALSPALQRVLGAALGGGTALRGPARRLVGIVVPAPPLVPRRPRPWNYAPVVPRGAGGGGAGGRLLGLGRRSARVWRFR